MPWQAPVHLPADPIGEAQADGRAAQVRGVRRHGIVFSVRSFALSSRALSEAPRTAQMGSGAVALRERELLSARSCDHAAAGGVQRRSVARVYNQSCPQGKEDARGREAVRACTHSGGSARRNTVGEDLGGRALLRLAKRRHALTARLPSIDQTAAALAGVQVEDEPWCRTPSGPPAPFPGRACDTARPPRSARIAAVALDRSGSNQRSPIPHQKATIRRDRLGAEERTKTSSPR